MLFLAVLGFCLLLSATALAAALQGLHGENRTEHFLVFAVCTSCAFFGFCLFSGNNKLFHIDISGTGRILLKDYYEVASRDCLKNSDGDSDDFGANALHVRLRNDSTLWAGLLLLRLQSDDGRLFSILVLPDSIIRQEFRALAVACRWIAAHGETQ